MRISGQNLLTVLLVLATTLSLYFMLNSQIKKPGTLNQNTPDKIISKLNFSEYNLQGQRVQHITANSATHIQKENTTYMVQPRMQIKDDQSMYWHISAKKSHSIHGADIIVAEGNVVLQHATHGNDLATKIQTSWLSLNQKTHLGYTNQNVTITRPDSITTGRGMTANFKTGTYKILHDAKIVYTPGW